MTEHDREHESPDEAECPPHPPARCQLCRRQVAALTKHHLIPRMRHRNKRTQRQFDRQAMTHRIAWLCRPCHKQVHALFSEKELAEHYHTLPALRGHPDMQRFIDWIAAKPADFVPRTHSRQR